MTVNALLAAAHRDGRIDPPLHLSVVPAVGHTPSGPQLPRRTAEECEAAAQAAAETAIEELGHATAHVEAACDCTTCLVRHVLEAAWPHLRDLALLGAASGGQQ